MDLTDDQLREVVRRVSEWEETVGTCLICGESNWSIVPKLFQLTEYHGGDVVIGGGAVIPVVPVSCAHCGNMHLLNAIRLGLVERDTEEQEESSEEEEVADEDPVGDEGDREK